MSQRQAYLRHPLEIAPLVFGLIFLGIVVAWGLFELDVVSDGDVAWILPVVLIASGTLGIVLAATKERRNRQRDENRYAMAPAAVRWSTGTGTGLDDTATAGHGADDPTDHITASEHTDDPDQPGAPR